MAKYSRDRLTDTDRTWKVKRSVLNEMNKEGIFTQGFKD